MATASAMPVWSRRPHIGTLPRVFQSTLPAAEALNRLSALMEGPGVTGAIDGASAWLRPRAWLRPPAATLRLTVTDQEADARVQCRFDPSRWDEIDLWIYGGAVAIGVAVASSWLTGHMPPAARAKITAGAPVFMAALAVVALAHYAFRRWRQAVRDGLFDRAMIALGVPIE